MILQHIIFEKNLHYLESYKQVLHSVGVIGDNKIVYFFMKTFPYFCICSLEIILYPTLVTRFYCLEKL